jgi:hypothetical protein
MRIKLNGWQRVGIVLSIIWAIGGGLWGNDLGLQQGDWVVSRLVRCYEAHSVNLMQWCSSDFGRDYSEAIKYHLHYAVIVALVPIPLAWLVVYGFIGLWRRIRRGFA